VAGEVEADGVFSERSKDIFVISYRIPVIKMDFLFFNAILDLFEFFTKADRRQNVIIFLVGGFEHQRGRKKESKVHLRGVDVHIAVAAVVLAVMASVLLGGGEGLDLGGVHFLMESSRIEFISHNLYFGSYGLILVRYLQLTQLP